MYKKKKKLLTIKPNIDNKITCDKSDKQSEKSYSNESENELPLTPKSVSLLSKTDDLSDKSCSDSGTVEDIDNNKNRCSSTLSSSSLI